MKKILASVVVFMLCFIFTGQMAVAGVQTAGGSGGGGSKGSTLDHYTSRGVLYRIAQGYKDRVAETFFSLNAVVNGNHTFLDEWLGKENTPMLPAGNYYLFSEKREVVNTWGYNSLFYTGAYFTVEADFCLDLTYYMNSWYCDDSISVSNIPDDFECGDGYVWADIIYSDGSEDYGFRGTCYNNKETGSSVFLDACIDLNRKIEFIRLYDTKGDSFTTHGPDAEEVSSGLGFAFNQYVGSGAEPQLTETYAYYGMFFKGLDDSIVSDEGREYTIPLPAGTYKVSTAEFGDGSVAGVNIVACFGEWGMCDGVISLNEPFPSMEFTLLSDDEEVRVRITPLISGDTGSFFVWIEPLKK